jgi:tetratricopeptide (TPR) repeat protein
MHKSVLVLATCVAFSSAPAWSQNWFGSKDTGKEADASAVSAEALAFASRQEEWSRPFLLALYRDGEWGAVLNLNRLGLAAMEKQRYGLARKAFDEAIARVEAIYADDENAKNARSVFNGEKVKDFKGEPYERAMLYYYRGLLYIQENDYQNARASFLAADRHDTLSSAENATYVGNFGLMKYLAGWASHCDGDNTRASQLISEARSADSKILGLPERPANSIILIDAGPGPVKWGDGKYKEVLKFKAGDGVYPSIAVKAKDGKALVDPVMAGDLNFQATTRGGREIDGIIAGKAQFKDTAGNIGNASMQIGAQAAALGIVSGNRDLGNAGMIGLLVGMVAKGVEQATTPAADIRGWDSLPGKVMVISANEIANAPLEFTVSGAFKPISLQATNGSCSVAWARTSSSLGTEMGGSAKFEDQKPTEANRGDRNKSFRAMLTSELGATK